MTSEIYANAIKKFLVIIALLFSMWWSVMLVVIGFLFFNNVMNIVDYALYNPPAGLSGYGLSFYEFMVTQVPFWFLLTIILIALTSGNYSIYYFSIKIWENKEAKN